MLFMIYAIYSLICANLYLQNCIRLETNIGKKKKYWKEGGKKGMHFIFYKNI